MFSEENISGDISPTEREREIENVKGGYNRMANAMYKVFGTRPVLYFPIDHGGLDAFGPFRAYLDAIGINYAYFVIDQQRAKDSRKERRPIITPYSDINEFLLGPDDVRLDESGEEMARKTPIFDLSECGDLVVTDDWAHGGSSIVGGTAYALEGVPILREAMPKLERVSAAVMRDFINFCHYSFYREDNRGGPIPFMERMAPWTLESLRNSGSIRYLADMPPIYAFDRRGTRQLILPKAAEGNGESNGLISRTIDSIVRRFWAKERGSDKPEGPESLKLFEEFVNGICNGDSEE
jgi:hypothetical protein